MANFAIRAAAGASIQDWVDAGGALPSRLNPTTGIAHKYLQVSPNALLVVLCTPDGLAEGAADSLLGGDLFVPYWAEAPCLSVPAFVQSAGQSANIQTRISTPGHYLLGVFRSNGGQQLMHLHCE